MSHETQKLLGMVSIKREHRVWVQSEVGLGSGWLPSLIQLVEASTCPAAHRETHALGWPCGIGQMGGAGLGSDRCGAP